METIIIGMTVLLVTLWLIDAIKQFKQHSKARKRSNEALQAYLMAEWRKAVKERNRSNETDDILSGRTYYVDAEGHWERAYEQIDGGRKA